MTATTPTEFFPCNWCGDPGENARAVVVETETGVESSEPVEFVACRDCLSKFLANELGWPL